MKTQTFKLLLLLLMSGSVLMAQSPSKFQRSNPNQAPIDKKNLPSAPYGSSTGSYGDMDSRGIKGTAYLNPAFIEGSLIFANGDRLDKQPLRYNLYTQQFQIIQNDDTLAIANADEIEYLLMADKVFVYTNYLCQGKHKSGYFELLENGECRLLKRWVATYHEVDPSGSSTIADDCFYRDCQCFIQFFKNPAAPVSSSKKDFIRSFANNGEEVKAYMKQEKLKAKHETDLIKIVDYYNTIQ
jgi:hypothetical protein